MCEHILLPLKTSCPMRLHVWVLLRNRLFLTRVLRTPSILPMQVLAMASGNVFNHMDSITPKVKILLRNQPFLVQYAQVHPLHYDSGRSAISKGAHRSKWVRRCNLQTCSWSAASPDQILNTHESTSKVLFKQNLLLFQFVLYLTYKAVPLHLCSPSTRMWKTFFFKRFFFCPRRFPYIIASGECFEKRFSWYIVY